MATTQNTFTGDGSTTNFSFTFEYIKQADVKAKIDGVNTTAFTLANATTVSFTSAPSNGAAIIIFRDTANDEKTATFFAGSAIKAEDLNSNFDQVLFTAQEVDNNALQTLGGTMSGNINMGANTNIVFEGTTDNANETTLTLVDPTADRTITLPDVTGTVVTTGDTGTVATGMIADSAITSAKISDGTIATGDIADDAVTTAKIADANVTTALIADASVTTAKLVSNAVTTAKITDANVTTAKIADDAITAAKIAANAVGSSEIAANAVTSSELADASVDTAAIVDANVTTVKVADAAITTAKINDSAITSAKIGANQVVEGKIADNAVTTSKIPDSGVTTPKIADNAVTNVKLADAELRELATMGSTTASALADLTQAEVQILDGATVSTNELNILDGVTANATEINQLDGNTLTNSFTASSTTQFPSSSAISGYVLGLMDNLGGFVAIANENSFPTTNPDPSDDAGTVVSISDAGGLVVSASGTASGQTTGGTAVTITGFPSALQSSTLPAGQGLQVVSTSTLNTYTYHKVLGTDADIAQLNDDVNDFFARYRIGSTNPTTDLDAGDLFFNTSTGKMLVYDATVTAWEEVQAVGNYFINTLSSSGGTGGGSATFNGSAYRFTLSNPGSVAQQHIVSINGVIQKPNSGTSQPSEGFAIDNADIILAAAPATGSEFFIVTVGTSVNIGTPSNDTITNAMVKADAAIAGTKISPDFGSQNVETTGRVLIGTTTEGNSFADNLTIADSGNSGLTIRSGTSSYGSIQFSDATSGAAEYAGFVEYRHSTNALALGTSSSQRMVIDSSGFVGIGESSPSSYDGGARQLVVKDSQNAGITIRSATNKSGSLYFADGTSGNEAYRGRIEYSHTHDRLQLGTAGTSSKVVIDSSGRLLVGATSAATSGSLAQYATFVLRGDTTGSTSAGIINLARGAGAASMSDGNSAGNITFSDNAGLEFGDIGFIADGTPSGSSTPGRFVVKTTASGSTTPTERMRIASDGTVGVGCTPNSFQSGYDAVQIGGNLVLNVDSTGAGAGVYMSNNVYRDSGNSRWEYINTDEASQYYQANGEHVWRYAASGSANAAITWSEAMRIDSSGNVGIGTTNAFNERLFVSGPGHNGHGSSNVRSVMSVMHSQGNSAGLWFGGRTDETTAVIGTRTATGNLAFETYNSGAWGERLRIKSNGETLIGGHTSVTTYSRGIGFGDAALSTSYMRIGHNSTGAAYSYILFGHGSADIGGIKQNSAGTAVSYNTTSDHRLKQNIVDIADGITRVKQLQPKRFNFIADATTTVDGFLAHEAQTVVPEAVTGTHNEVDDDGNPVYQGIDQSKLVPLLTAALQEAIAKIETLETQNADLTARITALEEGS